MARIDLPAERLSDYERAVCYYTLPRIVHPMTFGLIIVYCVCLFEAFTVLIYGVVTQQQGFIKLGAIVVFGIIAFGVVVFMARAFLNELRQRKVLAAARLMPAGHAEAVDIPDPFAGHVLLQHPVYVPGDLFACTDNDGELVYYVETAPGGFAWKVRDPVDNEILRVQAEAFSQSFLIREAAPSQLTVFLGEEKAAQVRNRFSFKEPTTVIDCVHPEPKVYTVRDGGIYRDKRLVGRIYYLRRTVYLDIEREEFHEALVGLFVTMA